MERLSLPEVNVDFSYGRRELAREDRVRPAGAAAAAAAQRLSFLAASVDNAHLNLKPLETRRARAEVIERLLRL